MLSTIEIVATHNNNRAAAGVIFDDGVVALRLTNGDKYASKDALSFRSLSEFMPLVGLFGNRFETKINGVKVTETELAEYARKPLFPYADAA